MGDAVEEGEAAVERHGFVPGELGGGGDAQAAEVAGDGGADVGDVCEGGGAGGLGAGHGHEGKW